MYNDDVRPDQLASPINLLFDRLAVVDDELQIEIRNPCACAARTRGRLAHVTSPSAKAEVAALDCAEQHRSVDSFGDHEHECRVAFELGELEVRPQCAD